MTPNKSFKPVATNVRDVKKPPTPKGVSGSVSWSFSFKYFQQIKYFGLSNTNREWYISLLERLRDLSTISKERLDSDYSLKDSYRYHPIAFGHKNVPIRRTELNWVDKNYIENEDEFPFYQFHVSKALGRIVGFWDSSSTVFHIVLLDPLHNIQPSNYNDYKVRDCYPENCEHTSLLSYVDELKKKTCNNDDCGFKPLVEGNAPHIYPERIIIAHIPENEFNEISEVLKKHSISELLALGAMSKMS